jgi:hypothetical protein
MDLRSVEAYLATLPGGVAAYPERAHKGESLSVWLQRSRAPGLAAAVPIQVAPLLDPERPFPAWVPEVHANVLYLAIREARFADDDAFLAHARACNRAVLQTPTNRVLFWALAPRAILRAAGLRWSSLHRGTSIDVRVASDTSAQLVLDYPPRLFPEIVLRGTATGFAVALENAGARDVRLELRECGETRALFEGRWATQATEPHRARGRLV